MRGGWVGWLGLIRKSCGRATALQRKRREANREIGVPGEERPALEGGPYMFF